MINYRKLTKDDNILFKDLIYYEGKNYKEFLEIGWSENQIINQLNKNTNLSFGAFYDKSLISFILGDFFNIEKISEYEILMLYVCKNFRKKGLGAKLLNIIEENNNCLKKIYLEVSKKNSEAILFYKKMKFKIIHTKKNYYLLENKRIDALLMNKSYY